MFNRNKKKYGVLKVYFEFSDANCKSILDAVINAYAAFSDCDLSFFSINYETERKFNKEALISKLGSISISDIELVNIRCENGDMGITIIPFMRESSVYELIVAIDDITKVDTFFTHIIKTLVISADIFFAYARRPATNVSPVSESVVSKSIFGSQSVKIAPVYDVWLQDPDEIKSGSIKGVYPCMLVRKDKLLTLDFFSRLQESKVELIPVSDEYFSFMLTDNFLGRLAKDVPNLKSYIRK